MRRAFADFSPAVPAAFAAGLGVALWIFLLPAGVVEKGPRPVLPALGGTAGRVAANLPVPIPVPAGARASQLHKAVSPHSEIVTVLRPPSAKARRVHHQARTGIVRGGSPVPAQKAPITRSQLFSIPEKAKGKAHGHDRGDASEPKADSPTPHPRGHGKALGRSNEGEDRLPPGQAKKASRASAPGPPSRKGNGGGNGRKGNDGGKGSKNDGDSDGRRGDEK